MRDVPTQTAVSLAEQGGRLMRDPLFAGRRLRASYRNTSGDFVIALLNEAAEQDDDFTDSYCLYRPRPSRRMKKEASSCG
jgi:hypothetical protein